MKWLLLLTILATAATASAFNTVVIDAGHGGRDRGGIRGQAVSEKELTLDVARRLNEILREEGIRTVMTRTRDTFVSLPKRAAIANAQRNAIFVSIHFNAASCKSAEGCETYYFRPSAKAIASRVQARLMKVEPGENRGVKWMPYYVLRNTRIPAVLAECGFLTNRSEASLCLKPAHQQEIANAIAKAIEASR